MLKRIIKTLAIALVVIFVLIVAGYFYLKIAGKANPPEVERGTPPMTRSFTQKGVAYCDNGWLRKNSPGWWEMYLRGDPYELGEAHGLLGQELIRRQEEAFLDQLNVLVPSSAYRSFLQTLIGYFNRNLDEDIPLEFRQEILGVSRFASVEFEGSAPAYQRILNYHAAHDIGHALQNMNLVACTAFGVWDGMSADSSLLIGRNFDFYVGDEFSENKVIAFISPDSGYRFAMITWGGMIGVVSGMNEKGLTVTLNAAKSDIPRGARTPVSIVARELLQYAADIGQVRAILEQRETFVSESFLIGSAADHKAVVIEKTPDKTGFFDPCSDHIILTNHFQSDVFSNDPLNLENIANETSLYRYRRVEELLAVNRPLAKEEVAAILRDQHGLGGKDIGMGNEKAVNQLIAHHGVIFQPEKLRIWVAEAPFQMGRFVCYDLGRVFSRFSDSIPEGPVEDSTLTIAADPFLLSKEWNNFLEWRVESGEWRVGVGMSEEWVKSGEWILNYLGLNPEFYLGYVLAGDYYHSRKDFHKAANYFDMALSKEVPSAFERKAIEEKLKKCQSRFN